MYQCGDLLAGKYRLVERVGSGGMGEVWRATDEQLDRPVAVKVMQPALLEDPEFRRRFRAEAQAMARIRHPGVVAVYDFGGDADCAFLVMEYVAGESLASVLRREGRLAPDRVMKLVTQAADALHTAHELGIVHRDVKPANLLVREDGTVVLTDFGIARMQEGTQLTATGALLGTLSYLAPEQVRGRPATAQSDVYALGVVAFECLTGRRPFDRDSPAATMMARVQDAPPTLAGTVPPGVAAALGRALATDPADRWASAHDFARACGDGPEPPAPAPATTPLPAQPRRPRRWLLPVAGVAVVVAGVVGAVQGVVAVLADDPVAPAQSEPPSDATSGTPPLAGEEITIAMLDGWEEGIAVTYLWKAAFESQGAEVTVEAGNAERVYEGVAGRAWDIGFDAWLPETHQPNWAEHPELVDLGTWYTGDAGLTIAVNEDAPIQSLDELAENADAFGNQIVGIEPGAGLTRITEQRVIPTYGLDDMEFVISSTTAMLTELETATDRGANIVVTLWEPHWAYDEFPIRNLEDPELALGEPEEIHSFSRPGFEEDFPEAAEWVSSWTLSADELFALMNVMFHERAAGNEAGYESGVQEWLDENPGYLEEMTASPGA